LKRKNATHRKSRIYCHIDASAVASVLLVLLFLFAAMHSVSDACVMGCVELVQTSRSVPVPSAMREDALAVGLSASGDLYFRSSKIHVNELEGILREGLKQGAEKRVYLNADGRTRYSDVKLVLSHISAAGIEDITIISR
jgi:biopolymer transport protein ExbD